MSNRTNIRFIHKADLYEKSEVTSAVGQKVRNWDLEVEGQVCTYSSDRAQTRVVPTV